MVPFAGWEMPVQYEGVIPEHVAVRTRAGAFDVRIRYQGQARTSAALLISAVSIVVVAAIVGFSWMRMRRRRRRA